MIYKFVSSDVSKLIRSGFLRIGSLHYYKNIEDADRRDNLEGIPDVTLGGSNKIVTAEEFNTLAESIGSIYRLSSPWKIEFKSQSTLRLNSDFNMHIFCTSLGSPGSSSKFGDQAFEIIDPAVFSNRIARAIKSKYDTGELLRHDSMDTVSGAHSAVSYIEGKLEQKFISADINGKTISIQAAFTKPSSYRDESEYRFAWYPYSIQLQKAISLPPRHNYIDLFIEDLSDLIRWL